MNEARLGCVLLAETAYGVDESADRHVVDFEITRYAQGNKVCLTSHK